MNRRVLVIVEGPTEFSVINSTIAPHLGAYGVYLSARVLGRPGHKGGIDRGFECVTKEIINLFKQEPASVVSTFFDFYGIPDAWPGVADAKAAKTKGVSASKVAGIIETAWQREIAKITAGFGHSLWFIPYIQMHEIEALLFTSPKDMAEGFLEPALESKFKKVVAECGGCEEINDRPNLAPSKRIEAVFPGYRKGRDKNKVESRRPHAPVIAARIGVASIRQACPHFNEWLKSLENLGMPPTTI